MAAGDIYSSMYNTGTTTIQPAGSTKVCITWLSGDQNCNLYGVNGSGSYKMYGAKSDSSQENDKFALWNNSTFGMKLFIDNTDYIEFQSGSCSYSGVEV